MRRVLGWSAVVAFMIALAIAGILVARSARGVRGSSQLALAIARARTSLGGFRDRLEHPRPGDKAFFVRARFSQGATAETLWMGHVRAVTGGFRGTLAEAPFSLTKPKKGDEVTVFEQDVLDWTILRDDGSKEGNFTAGLEPR